MTPQEIECMVVKAVKEAMAEERENFHIDREEHYRHHDFVGGLMQVVKETKGVVRRTIVKTLVWGGILIVLFGIVVWLRLNISDLPHGLSTIPKMGGK